MRRLYEGFQPDNYQLSISPDAEKMNFKGVVTIRGKKAGRPSQRLTFHQKDLKITSAKVIKHDKKGDEEIVISRINTQNTLHELRLHSDSTLYSGNYTVILEFEGIIVKNMTGLYPCFYTHEGKEKVLLATQFESHYAREVFPCIDEPEAKATFDLAVTAKTGLTVLGNTPVRSSLDNEDGTTDTIFETSPRMSTYLLAFVLGEIHGKTRKTKSGIEVGVWGTVAQPENAFDFALESGVKIVEFFEEYFKVPYPLPKLDHIGLPDFAVGAMENWGLITYREAVFYLYPESPSQSLKETIALVVAHETSHQWFGNLVTMKWWDDLWLNESFANMMEYEAVDSVFPEWNIWESFITGEALQAWRRDATPGVQPVKLPVHHPDEVSALFDPSIVYAKGGRILYMLKNYLGEAAFRSGLQHYFQTHAYKNTVGADLWKSLATASKVDVSAFMDLWLERSGFPVVHVTQNDKEIRLSQEHFLEDPAKADPDRIWPVPLFIDQPDAPLILEKKEVTSSLTNGSYVLVNQEARGHFLVHYETEPHRQALIDRIIKKELGTIDRLNLLNSSSMLARAGLQSFGETLKLLNAYGAETEEAVWDVMSLILADTRRFIDLDKSLDDRIKSLADRLVQQEYARLGWEEKPNEPVSDQKLRATIIGLGAYADNPEIVKKAQELYGQYKKDANSVSGELRGIVLSVAVKTEYDDALEYLLQQYPNVNSDLQHDIAGGLTSTRTDAGAQKLFDVVTDHKYVKPQDANRWIFSLLRNRYVRNYTWQWMEDNWKWIEDTYDDDKSYDYFPRFAAAVANTRELQQKFIKFFTPLEENRILQRNILIGKEEIENRLTWLERDIKAVQEFFSK